MSKKNAYRAEEKHYRKKRNCQTVKRRPPCLHELADESEYNLVHDIILAYKLGKEEHMSKISIPDHIKPVLKSEAKTRVCIMGRRTSKTLLAATVATEALKSGLKVIVFSSTFQQKQHIRKLINSMATTGNGKIVTVEADRQRYEDIDSYDVTILDDIRLRSSGELKHIHSRALATGKLLVIDNADHRYDLNSEGVPVDSYIYTLYERGVRKEEGYYSFQYPSPKTVLEQTERSVKPRNFKTDYLAEWEENAPEE